MIHVIATLRLKPGVRQAFLEAFSRLTLLVRDEVGCIEYGAAVDEPTAIGAQALAGDDAVVVVEKWESVPALEAHLAAPHMAAFHDETGAMAEGVSILVLRPA